METPIVLVTYGKAAAMLTVSTATVRRLVAAGKLRAVAISPRCHRVDVASIQAHLQASHIEPSIIVLKSSKGVAVKKAGVDGHEVLSLAEALERARRRLSRQAVR